MNVLLLSLADFSSIEDRGIYPDLLREFRRHGHRVYAVSPVQKNSGQTTRLIEGDGFSILKLVIGNIQKSNNLIEKGIATLQVEPQFLAGIKKYFSDVKFDLVLAATPPITFCSSLKYLKKRDSAYIYLLLKDIFPYNAVDMGMLSETGIKGIVYRHFWKEEKRLYSLSDRIGCMSRANVDFLLEHNLQIPPEKVEISPNCTEIINQNVGPERRVELRQKYGLPEDKKIFVYGGNLGKPQDIPFVISCIRECASIEDAFFLVIGSGVEFGVLRDFYETEHPKNFKLMKGLPKNEYDDMVGACDVGLVFLWHGFTFPNFPSRVLSYTMAKLPVLAATDSCSDIGKAIVDGRFGWWCESSSAEAFADKVKAALASDLQELGENGFTYCAEHWNVKKQFEGIIRNL